MHAGYIRVLVEVQIDELLAFVRDVVLLHCLIHVERSAKSLPGVAGGMLVELKVSVENFVHGFLAAALDGVVGLSQLIDNSNFPGLLAQAADAECPVSPPWLLETRWLPGAIWHKWRHVQISAHWGVVPVNVGLRIDGHLGLMSVVVKPVCDVGSCSSNQRLARFEMNIVLNKLG